MFGMVTALVIQEKTTAGALLRPAPTAAAATAGPIRTAALQGGSTAYTCQIPGATD
jgi:hypothetical protein